MNAFMVLPLEGHVSCSVKSAGSDASEVSLCLPPTVRRVAVSTEIRLAKDHRALIVVFDDGARFELSAELLRVTSPSAEVQGHSEAERKTVGGKRNVTILSVDPVGNYAVRIGFDDLHSTGIFSWEFLHNLGRNAERQFQSYLDDLAAKGLDRDKPGVR